jgi:hypothetical protein
MEHSGDDENLEKGKVAANGREGGPALNRRSASSVDPVIEEDTVRRLRAGYGAGPATEGGPKDGKRAVPARFEPSALAEYHLEKRRGCVGGTHWFFCGTPCRTLMGLLALLCFAVLFWSPIVWYVFVPRVINLLASGTSVNVVNVTLSEPGVKTMDTEGYIEINNHGIFAVEVESFNATLRGQPEEAHPGGRPIGWMMVPGFSLPGNSPGLVFTKTVMHVSDGQALNDISKRMLNGEAVPWQLSSEMTVWALGLPFAVALNKQVTFPPLELKNYVTENLRMSHGNATTNQLIIDADLSFYSASPMRLLRFGELIAELYYNTEANDGSLQPSERRARGGVLTDQSVKVGECVMADYRVVQGMNTIKARIFLDANAATGASLGRWASKIDQTFISVAPINKYFLNGIWEGSNDMLGSAITMYSATFATRDTFVKGYNPKTGAACTFWDQGAESCNKGAMVMGMNPFQREWFLRDISYDIYLEEAYEYEGRFRVNVPPLNMNAVEYRCAPSRAIGRTYSTPGMWAGYPEHRPGVGLSYPDDDPTTAADERLEARLADDVIPVPPASADGTPAVYSFSMPVKPIPGLAERINLNGNAGPCIFGLENVNPFDCCMTTIFTAAACKAAERGEMHLVVTSSGNATMIVDGVSIKLSTSVRMPVSYTKDMLDFDALGGDDYGVVGVAGSAGFSCADLTFTGVSAP